MMPKDFEDSNIKFAEGQDNFLTLPARVDWDGRVVTCWKLSEADLKKLNETGELWLSQFKHPADQLQPLIPSCEKPEVTFNPKQN